MLLKDPNIHIRELVKQKLQDRHVDPEIDLCESGKASVNNYIIHFGVTIKSDHTVRGVRTGGGGLEWMLGGEEAPPGLSEGQKPLRTKQIGYFLLSKNVLLGNDLSP